MHIIMEQNDFLVKFIEKYQKDIIYLNIIVYIIWLLS